MELLKTVEGALQKIKAPVVAVSDLTTSTLSLTVYYWLDTFNDKYSGVAIRNEAIEKSIRALEQAGFYLPGDIIELKNYKGSELKSGVKAV